MVHIVCGNIFNVIAFFPTSDKICLIVVYSCLQLSYSVLYLCIIIGRTRISKTALTHQLITLSISKA